MRKKTRARPFFCDARKPCTVAAAWGATVPRENGDCPAPGMGHRPGFAPGNGLRPYCLFLERLDRKQCHTPSESDGRPPAGRARPAGCIGTGIYMPSHSSGMCTRTQTRITIDHYHQKKRAGFFLMYELTLIISLADQQCISVQATLLLVQSTRELANTFQFSDKQIF